MHDQIAREQSSLLPIRPSSSSEGWSAPVPSVPTALNSCPGFPRATVHRTQAAAVAAWLFRGGQSTRRARSPDFGGDWITEPRARTSRRLPAAISPDLRHRRTPGAQPVPATSAPQGLLAPVVASPASPPRAATWRSEWQQRHGAGLGAPLPWPKHLSGPLAVLLASALVAVPVVGIQPIGSNGWGGPREPSSPLAPLSHQDRAGIVPVPAPAVPLLPTTSGAYSVVTTDGGAASSRLASLVVRAAGRDGAVYSSGRARSAGRASQASPPSDFSRAGPLTTPPGYSPSQLIWQDNFSGTRLDRSKWNKFMSSIASHGLPWNSYRAHGTTYSAISPPDSVDAEVDSPGLVSVHNGLTLRAVPGSPVPGYHFTGAVVDTYGKFAWSGGYFQARVKMPNTVDGYWPAIWFLPAADAGTHSDIGEFDLQEGGTLGSGPVNGILRSALHVAAGGSPRQTNTGIDLSAGFHTYGAAYVPGRSLTVYFDGRLVTQFTQDVPRWPLQLIISLAVGSRQTAKWHTTGSPAASAMEVSEIQFYS